MKVTRITKKNEKNVIIWLDNEEKLFLSYEVLLKNGLRLNSEISESHFSFLIRENQKYFIKQSAYNILSRRVHSVKELQNKLRNKKYDPELINEIINHLISLNLLNDFKFAADFIEEKVKLSAWGKSRLKVELMKRGVSQEIISKLLDENLSEDTQYENAVKLAEKKLKILNNRQTDKVILVRKLYTFLQSKGYNYSISKQAVESIFKISFEEDL